MKKVLLGIIFVLAACDQNSNNSDTNGRDNVIVSGQTCDETIQIAKNLDGGTVQTVIKQWALAVNGHPVSDFRILTDCLDQNLIIRCTADQTCFIEAKPH